MLPSNIGLNQDPQSVEQSLPFALVLQAIDNDHGDPLATADRHHLLSMIARTHETSVQTIKNIAEFQQAIRNPCKPRTIHTLILIAHGLKNRIYWGEESMTPSDLTPEDFMHCIPGITRIALFVCFSQEFAQAITNLSHCPVYAPKTAMALVQTIIDEKREIRSYNTENNQILYKFQYNAPAELLPAASLAQYRQHIDDTIVRLTRLAQDHPSPHLCSTLGNMLAMQTWDSKTSNPQARQWLQLAAKQGDAFAQYHLGLFCTEGRGGPQSDAEAREWFQLAARQESAPAKYALGILYAEGRGGPQLDAEARGLYQSSAKQEYPPAQYALGFFCAEGRGGPQSDVEAREWLRLAAEQEYPPAQCALGFFCVEGRGGPQSDEDARKWLQLAATQGFVAAQEYCLQLERSKSPSTIHKRGATDDDSEVAAKIEKLDQKAS